MGDEKLKCWSVGHTAGNLEELVEVLSLSLSLFTYEVTSFSFLHDVTFFNFWRTNRKKLAGCTLRVYPFFVFQLCDYPQRDFSSAALFSYSLYLKSSSILTSFFIPSCF